MGSGRRHRRREVLRLRHQLLLAEDAALAARSEANRALGALAARQYEDRVRSRIGSPGMHFPPPLITKWLASSTVPTDALVAELTAWADFFREQSWVMSETHVVSDGTTGGPAGTPG